jgi:hypothetical protein
MSRRHARPASSYVASTRGRVDVSGGRWTPSDWLNQQCVDQVPGDERELQLVPSNDIVDDDVGGAVVTRGTASISLI